MAGGISGREVELIVDAARTRARKSSPPDGISSGALLEPKYTYSPGLT